MRQHEAVIEVMRSNGGYATLAKLYKEALQVTGVDWKKTKTPFKSINRIVQDERFFFRIRPGLWALKDWKGKLPKEIANIEDPEYSHGYFQGLLVELGNLEKLETFVTARDRNRTFMSKPLGSVATLTEMHQFTYDEIVKRAKMVDVVWFNDRKMPHTFFEVEHTSDFDASLLKFLKFQDFYCQFRIVASENKEREYAGKISHFAYKAIANRTKFTSYKVLSDYHSKAHAAAAAKRFWD